MPHKKKQSGRSTRKTRKRSRTKKKSAFPKWLSKYYALKTLHPKWPKTQLYKEAGKPSSKK